MASQKDAALNFVNQSTKGLRGRPRTSLPKAPANSDPVTVALEKRGLADKIADAPKSVAAFIKAFKAGKYPDLVAS